MVANRPSAASHEERVAAVASQVFALAARRAPAHIDKGGVHHFVPLPGDRRFRGARVDASPLRHVLDVDPDRRLCTCEPGVSFRALVEATLAHGLLPTVVPELEGITVGGAVAGCSVESMSFRHGGFHDSCLEYEVVTGTGEILVCSPEREPLAFHMLHGSYGTLGILTRATFRLVPARPFVRLEYRHLRTAEAFRGEALASTRDAEIDFLDGIVHGPNHFVLCVGRFVDDAPMRSDYRGEEIFYRATAERTEDYLSTADYCFRYDTECHWMTATVPPLQWRIVRRLVGRWFLGSTNLIRWSNALAPLLALKRRPDVVCDYFLPADLDGLLPGASDHCPLPLWVVPYCYDPTRGSTGLRAGPATPCSSAAPCMDAAATIATSTSPRCSRRRPSS